MSLTDRCFYCGREDRALEACCHRHPDDLVCTDRAGCRDFILAALAREAKTDDGRFLIAEARRIGPALRAGAGDRERLAGEIIDRLCDLAERLAAEIAETNSL
jgi:hypothetical protein